MEISRRAFIGSAAALASMPGWSADEKPLFKVGFMTDTHVGTTKKSCERVKGAFAVFKAQGCEAIVNCGDLADWHYVEGYRYYLEELEAAYPPDMANRPQFLYVMANHDALDPARKDPKLRATRAMDFKAAFMSMREKLKIDHECMDQRELHGYPFLVFPQQMLRFGGYGEMEKRVAKACADYPGKPVFVCTHMPSSDTCYNSRSWGSVHMRKVLNKFPQVVQFSGHTHGSLRNEMSIWQGEFTAVDVCCLQEWHGICVGSPLSGKQEYGVVVMEVFPTRLVIRRFDVRDGSEIFPDRPWVVPLPYDRATAPFNVASRAAKARPGVFAASSKLGCVADRTPFTCVKLSFPSVKNEEDVERYRIEIARRGADGGWEKFACCEVFSEFYLRPQDRKGVYERTISSAYLDDADAEYRFTVTPVGFFGTLGKPLENVWTAPARKAMKVVWSCDNPMEELDFRYGSPRSDADMRSAKKVPLRDGWYEPPSLAWLMLKPGVWNMPKWTKIRLVAEMSFDQPELPEGWNLYLNVNDGTQRGIRGGWTSTPGGKTDIFRYVVESTLREPGLDYAITLGRGTGGRVKFRNVRIECED